MSEGAQAGAIRRSQPRVVTAPVRKRTPKVQVDAVAPAEMAAEEAALVGPIRVLQEVDMFSKLTVSAAEAGVKPSLPAPQAVSPRPPPPVQAAPKRKRGPNKKGRKTNPFLDLEAEPDLKAKPEKKKRSRKKREAPMNGKLIVMVSKKKKSTEHPSVPPTAAPEEAEMIVSPADELKDTTELSSCSVVMEKMNLDAFIKDQGRSAFQNGNAGDMKRRSLDPSQTDLTLAKKPRKTKSHSSVAVSPPRSPEELSSSSTLADTPTSLDLNSEREDFCGFDDVSTGSSYFNPTPKKIRSVAKKSTTPRPVKRRFKRNAVELLIESPILGSVLQDPEEFSITGRPARKCRQKTDSKIWERCFENEEEHFESQVMIPECTIQTSEGQLAHLEGQIELLEGQVKLVERQVRDSKNRKKHPKTQRRRRSQGKRLKNQVNQPVSQENLGSQGECSGSLLDCFKSQEMYTQSQVVYTESQVDYPESQVEYLESQVECPESQVYPENQVVCSESQLECPKSQVECPESQVEGPESQVEGLKSLVCPTSQVLRLETQAESPKSQLQHPETQLQEPVRQSPSIADLERIEQIIEQVVKANSPCQQETSPAVEVLSPGVNPAEISSNGETVTVALGEPETVNQVMQEISPPLLPQATGNEEEFPVKHAEVEPSKDDLDQDIMRFIMLKQMDRLVTTPYTYFYNRYTRVVCGVPSETESTCIFLTEEVMPGEPIAEALARLEKDYGEELDEYLKSQQDSEKTDSEKSPEEIDTNDVQSDIELLQEGATEFVVEETNMEDLLETEELPLESGLCTGVNLPSVVLFEECRLEDAEEVMEVPGALPKPEQVPDLDASITDDEGISNLEEIVTDEPDQILPEIEHEPELSSKEVPLVIQPDPDAHPESFPEIHQEEMRSQEYPVHSTDSANIPTLEVIQEPELSSKEVPLEIHPGPNQAPESFPEMHQEEMESQEYPVDSTDSANIPTLEVRQENVPTAANNNDLDPAQITESLPEQTEETESAYDVSNLEPTYDPHNTLPEQNIAEDDVIVTAHTEPTKPFAEDEPRAAATTFQPEPILATPNQNDANATPVVETVLEEKEEAEAGPSLMQSEATHENLLEQMTVEEIASVETNKAIESASGLLLEPKKAPEVPVKNTPPEPTLEAPEMPLAVARPETPPKALPEPIAKGAPVETLSSLVLKPSLPVQEEANKTVDAVSPQSAARVVPPENTRATFAVPRNLPPESSVRSPPEQLEVAVVADSTLIPIHSPEGPPEESTIPTFNSWQHPEPSYKPLGAVSSPATFSGGYPEQSPLSSLGRRKSERKRRSKRNLPSSSGSSCSDDGLSSDESEMVQSLYEGRGGKRKSKVTDTLTKVLLSALEAEKRKAKRLRLERNQARDGLNALIAQVAACPALAASINLQALPGDVREALKFHRV